MSQYNCGSGRRRPPLGPGNPGPEVEREIEELNREIALLARQQDECQEKARDLMAREMDGEGPFAREVFELKQAKLRLATEAQHLRVRINHLLYGVAPTRGGK